jgi:general secretion pathway protein C
MMLALSPERSSLALTAVVLLTTLAALAFAAAVFAYWTWVWVAPPPEPRAQPAAEPIAGTASAQGLFGTAQRQRDAAVPTGIAVKLLGVVAATRGHRGYAVMQLEGREIIAVAQGQDAAPGVQVAEVHPDHVILSRNGVRETLAWPQKKPPPETAVPRNDKASPGSP